VGVRGIVVEFSVAGTGKEVEGSGAEVGVDGVVHALKAKANNNSIIAEKANFMPGLPVQ
jgi:hypothetical protein